MKPFLLHRVLVLAIMFLAGCSKRDSVVVGMDATYPPFEFKDQQGRISGVSVAIGKAIGKTAGKPVEFVSLSFDGLIPALQTGRIDLIISSLTANDERRRSIDFSDPYVKTGLSILASNKSTVAKANDLKAPGRKIAVRIGTTGEQWCRKELPNAHLVSLDTDTACVLEVVNGTADAWVYDQVSVMNYHAAHPDTTRALLQPLREEVWAVGMKKGREELKAQVNQALKVMREEGQFSKLADEFLARERAMMKAQGLPFVFE